MGIDPKRLFGWDHITKEYIYALLVLLCIMHFFIFHIWQNMIKSSETCLRIDEACIIGCPFGICPPDWVRGNGYEIGRGTKPQCLLTSWEFSHLIFHIFIGYFFNIWISLGLGIAFEAYEWVCYDCASLIDIFANTTGCLLGAALHG